MMTRTMILHPRLIYRQLLRFRLQAVVFVLCAALSMVSLVAVGSFSRSVDRFISGDARKLHGGDILIRSERPFSAGLLEAVAGLERDGVATVTRLHEFYSVVSTEGGGGTLLSRIKAVDRSYPLYGTVALASGRTLQEAVVSGRVAVEQALLDRLGLSAGDVLRIGSASLVIDDVILGEPDRPVRFFSFGPGILLSADDLAATDLVKAGSRVRHRLLLKVTPEIDAAGLAEGLHGAADPDSEQVETYRTAGSRIQRFLDNFFFFLDLIGIFTLLLAGMGMQSSLAAMLRQERTTVAIMKTLGARSRFVTLNTYAVVTILGGIGALAGTTAGIAMQGLIARFFHQLLPPDLVLAISPAAIVEGVSLGVLVVAVFTYLPMAGMRAVRPAAIFRKEPDTRRERGPVWTASALVASFFALVVWLHIRQVHTGLVFMGGALGLLGVILLATSLLLAFFRRQPLSMGSLVVRQALRGLFRPGNATRSIIVTLSVSLTIIFCIYLVERNLNDTFIDAYPEDAPNLFLLDIQPEQVTGLSQLIDRPVVFYPVVRARLVAVNGARIDRRAEVHRRGDNLARPFNLTYREHLLEDEVLSQGARLFHGGDGGAQVSILDTVADMQEMTVGDRLRFNIQGVPVDATISSIRSMRRGGVRPFFYFVFQEATLKRAPQTIFTALQVDPGLIPSLQGRIAARFPNISTIDVSATLRTFSGVMRKLSGIVRFFAVISVLAGILIVISSTLATRFARIQEAVYYRILGARKRFVLMVFATENVVIGTVSGTLALIAAQTAAYLFTTSIWAIDYHFYGWSSVLLPVIAAAIVTVAGLSASMFVVDKRPVHFLREQNDG